MIIVTGCDRKYLPGVKALKNSLDKNSPGHELVCFTHGDLSLQVEVADLGYTVIPNPTFPEGTRLPVGDWGRLASSEYAMPAMYSRLLMGEVFDTVDRVFWIDSDCIVMGDLSELETIDMNKNILRTTSRDGLARMTDKPLSHPVTFAGLHMDGYGCGIGTMLVDVDQWLKQDVLYKCIDVMSRLDLRYVCQDALNIAMLYHYGNLGKLYNWNVKRYAPAPTVKIIHWPAMLPWDANDSWNGKPKSQRLQKTAEKYWQPYA